jgi:chromosome segregation ATPase
MDEILSKQRLSELLTELNRELQEAGDVDPETRELLSQLNDDIDRLTGDTQTAVDRAKNLESQFAAKHPVAERIAREFADLLAKMGI